jgi:hypothetical protein
MADVSDVTHVTYTVTLDFSDRKPAVNLLILNQKI